MNYKAHLLKIDFKKCEEISEALSINTPIGKIVITVCINAEKFQPSFMQNGLTSANSSIYIWDSQDYHLEFLKGPFRPELPKDMHVDGCIGFLLRFQCLKTIQPSFICKLISNKHTLEVIPESGEGLAAQSFQDATTQLTIGTEDEDFLRSRAKHQNQLPHRFFTHQLISLDTIEYLENGIKISLPEFLQGEEGQVQFIISWLKMNQTNRLSTWFAVDVSPEDILKQIT